MATPTKEVEFTIIGVICTTCKLKIFAPDSENGTAFYTDHKDHEVMLEVVTEGCATPFTMQFKES